MPLYIFITLLTFLLSVNSIYGSTIPLKKELYAIHYGQHNGLPTTNIYDLTQDDKGFLYLGTGKGLFRYDGFSFQSMNENVDNYMGGSALSVFKKDHIFYESFDGYVYQFHQKKWKSFNVNKPVHFLKYGINKDTLSVVQKNGIDIYHISQSKYLRTVKFPVGSPQSTLQIGAHYYLINEDYLIKTDTRSLKKKIDITEISSTKTIRHIYYHQNKIYIVGRSTYSEGVWVFDLNLNFLYKIDVKEVDGIIQHIDFIDEKVLISSNKGIFVFDHPNDKWQFKETFFRGSNVSRILKGKNNEYWISVIGKGLYLIPNPSQFVYSFLNEGVTKILCDSAGYLIGTNSGNIYHLKENFSSATFVLQNPMKTPINYLYKNDKDLFYVPALGFYHISSNKNKFYDLALKSVADIDHKYYVLATSSHLLLYLKQDQQKNAQPSQWDEFFNKNRDSNGFALLMDGLRSKTVCYDDKSGKIYVLTNAGLFSLDKRGISEELLINKQSIIADHMRFAEDKLYYLTYSGELYVFSNGQTKKLDINSRVLDFKLFDSSLVLKTNNGFVIYNTHTKKLKHINFKCEPTSIGDFSLDKNNLLVLMPSGLIEVPINAEIRNNELPKFIIENFKIGEKYTSNFPKKLAHYSNSLEINYSILDYTYAPSYSLYYRINHGKWEKLPSTSRKLQFHKLSPGNYLVEFKINEEFITDQIKFEIEPPYWETWWFYLLTSITTAFILSYYYRNRRRKLQTQIKLLEDKVILEKKLGQSLLTSIKAQMNPHFYFNALNSIQAFIYKNDKEHALEYLSKFSKLTRNILAQTEVDNILLEEEIATLQLYLDLEKVRFSNRFSYVINCDSKIDTKMVRIPAMLIQPYVENSVKHGFTKLTTNGLIKIQFETCDKYLYVTVEDNGIGRTEAQAIKKGDDLPSFSSEANKKRLEILNHNSENKVSIIYEDVINERGDINGTRVKIVIPLNHH